MKLANQQLTRALKEWAIAIEALGAGETILLLRKGGIREKSFQVKSPVVWLYPTYEHQKPHLLKSEYASRVVPVESGWHPKTVEIKSCGKITDILEVATEDRLAALQPYHIWNEQMVGDRLKWKPQQPLVVLLLRVYCLPSPQLIAYRDAYGGCKSWIELAEPIATESLTPVLEDRHYQQRVSAIKSAIASNLV